ncbi:hypothetical protein BDV23DRAFT_85794 [Aspergillus alliaceus]|nr:hypothetical protein BDV23DRAFT_85794 [Aspergillus alliaceus]
MSSSWKDRLLPSLHALLLSCSRATVLASEVRFEEDLTTSQDQALAVLIELDAEVKCLLRRILQPIACQPPPNPLLTSVLLGSTCALDLFERRIRLYGLSSQGRESVCESWTRLIETLQQYTMNLQSLIGAFDPVS